MECGATCLRMIAKFHGKEYSAATMQNLCVVTREGVSMLGISDAAEYIGFRTICGRMTLGKMVEQRRPPLFISGKMNAIREEIPFISFGGI